MLPPVNREGLRRRAELDLEDERQAAALETIEARLELSLELSELAYEARDALGATWHTDDLAEKARLLAKPLRLLRGP
jgi:hypothetical protein